MRLLIDMNLTPLWVSYLAEAGHDAVHWSQVGAIDAPDEQLMAWAAGEGRTLLTQDLDFGLLLRRSGGSQPSVVQIRAQGTLPTDIGPAVVSA